MGKSVRGPDGKKMKKDKSRAEETPATLSNFLLADVEAKDAALDDIFAHSSGPSIAFLPPVETKVKKQKRKAESPVPEPAAEPEVEAEDEEEAEIEVDNDAELSEADSNESLGLASDSEDDDGVEEAYAARAVAARLKALAEGTKGNKRKAEADPESGSGSDGEGVDESAGESDDDDDMLDIDNLVHESLLPKAIYKEVPATAKDVKKAKVDKARAASTETPEERDARTLFLGNVPVDCSTSRPMKKALIRHVLQSPSLLAMLPPDCPPLKADSIRFRSLAFASTVFGRKAVVDPAADPAEAPVEPGGRGRKRAKNWRETEGTDERGVKGGFRHKEEAAPAPDKANKRQPLTDGQKRRVAFIRGEINEGKKVCNAYLVLDKLPASYDTLSMKDILAAIVQDTNGSSFEGMTLRADAIRPRSSASTVAAAKLASKPSKADSLDPPNTGPSYTVPPVEARRTIFMGGLDFAESEENVRAATEAILVKERGPSGDKGWVEGVRIVRDASTGLGKGFGYVLMRDAECVDELLALPFGQPLKVSKRKPRLERCKTGVAAARAKAASAARDIKVKAAKLATGANAHSGITGAVPRDPKPRAGARPSTSESAHQAKLAEALAKLPQDERKAIKAIDPERLWRRAQKKKNKVLGERYERKQANSDKATGILGRPSRSMDRARKEKKRVAAGNKTGKRAKI